MTNNTTPPDKGPEGTPEGTISALPLRWVKVTHRSADHIAARYPYAAYGSNLCLEQMVRRCPSAEIVGAGTLRDARMLFAYYMGIEQAEGSTVPMAVYKMTAHDVAAMDRHEGIHHRARNLGYERYLVTVEVNGAAVRCFTYVKRDNAIEEPSERYYQTCLRGYSDWNFDSRRLRHARDHARKHGIRRTYSDSYGWWSNDGLKAINYDKYRKGTAVIPPVPSYDDTVGMEEPDGNGTAASHQPKMSLVTGRELPSSRRARNGTVRKNGCTGCIPKCRDCSFPAWDEARRNAGRPSHTTLMPLDDPTRVSKLNETGQTEFTNAKGERWTKGKNNVWYRVKE